MHCIYIYFMTLQRTTNYKKYYCCNSASEQNDLLLFKKLKHCIIIFVSIDLKQVSIFFLTLLKDRELCQDGSCTESALLEDWSLINFPLIYLMNQMSKYSRLAHYAIYGVCVEGHFNVFSKSNLSLISMGICHVLSAKYLYCCQPEVSPGLWVAAHLLTCLFFSPSGQMPLRFSCLSS